MALDGTKTFFNVASIIQRDTFIEVPVPSAPGAPTLGTLCWVSENGGQLYVLVADPDVAGNPLVWKQIGTTGGDNQWTGKQTFYTTVFKRAPIPESQNANNGFNLLATSAPLIRVVTSGAPAAVNLFSPIADDIGKQWVFFDASRDAAAQAITVQCAGPIILNGAVGGNVQITTDGGAIVLRVLAAGQWESLGF